MHKEASRQQQPQQPIDLTDARNCPLSCHDIAVGGLSDENAALVEVWAHMMFVTWMLSKLIDAPKNGSHNMDLAIECKWPSLITSINVLSTTLKYFWPPYGLEKTRNCVTNCALKRRQTFFASPAADGWQVQQPPVVATIVTTHLPIRQVKVISILSTRLVVELARRVNGRQMDGW